MTRNTKYWLTCILFSLFHFLLGDFISANIFLSTALIIAYLDKQKG